MTRLLIAGAVVGFFAMAGVTLALIRHIRRRRIAALAPPARKAPREFFEAGEYRTPRPLRLHQEVIGRSLSDVSFPDAQGSSLLPRQASPGGNDFESKRLSSFGASNFSPVATRPVFAAQAQHSSDAPATQRIEGIRKPPQSVAPVVARKVTLSYFNEQTGQLIDPPIDPRAQIIFDSEPSGNEKIDRLA